MKHYFHSSSSEYLSVSVSGPTIPSFDELDGGFQRGLRTNYLSLSSYNDDDDDDDRYKIESSIETYNDRDSNDDQYQSYPSRPKYYKPKKTSTKRTTTVTSKAFDLKDSYLASADSRELIRNPIDLTLSSTQLEFRFRERTSSLHKDLSESW